MSKTASTILSGSAWVFAASYLARSFILFTSHYYNVASEANALYAILEFSSGRPLYPTRDMTPYYVNLYPPVHAYLAKAMLAVFPLKSLHSQVMVVRVISVFGGLVAGFLMVRRFLPLFGIPPVFGALVLAAIGAKFADYTGVARNDLLALALDSGSVLSLAHFLKNSKAKGSLFAGTLLAFCSCWTRQTGALVYGSFLLVLVVQGRRYLALWLGVIFAGANLATLVGLNAIYPAFWENVVLANLRSWRPINRQFFDASLGTFVLSYFFFLPLTYLGFQRWNQTRQNREVGLLFLVVGLTTLLHASVLFLRAGGDVNYFLPSLFFLTPFFGLELQYWLNKKESALLVAGVLTLHFLGTAGICAIKARSSAVTSALPFEEAAEQLRRLPKYGFLDGFYAQGLGVNLRGWAIHGPDVTNGGKVASNSHWTYSQIWLEVVEKAQRGEVKTGVFASVGCEEGGRVALYPWLCIYPLQGGLIP